MILRALTDGKSILRIYPGPDGCVSTLSRRSFTNFPIEVLDAIAEAFDTEIYSEDQPQFWGFATRKELDAWMDGIKSEHRDEFYEELLQYLNGKDDVYHPGTVGSGWMDIAKKLVLEKPELSLRENKETLLNAIKQGGYEQAVVVELDSNDIAVAKMLVTSSTDLPEA